MTTVTKIQLATKSPMFTCCLKIHSYSSIFKYPSNFNEDPQRSHLVFMRAHHLKASKPLCCWGHKHERCWWWCGMEAILLITCARFRQHDVHVILGDPFSSVFATLLQAKYLVTLYSAFSWQVQYVLILLVHFGCRRSIWWTSSSSSSAFHGKRSIWWTSSSIFRSRRNIWWTYTSMFRRRRKELEGPGGQTCGETLNHNVGIQCYAYFSWQVWEKKWKS